MKTSDGTVKDADGSYLSSVTSCSSITHFGQMELRGNTAFGLGRPSIIGKV